jgi:DHA1 family bicyclomycin/chloramphenicol resistance-like MFS transporter
MFEKPLYTIRSSKIYDFAHITLVTIMYITLCAEADIYVPAFPKMVHFFGVLENQIQLILSINFVGLCIAGLATGPLSDSYGRRKVLLGGLLLFVVSSIGCVYTDNFKIMLLWRLLQGIAASVPMVIGAATFLDKYSAEKAGQLIGVINSVIAASMAGAPIIGAWISQIFNWRANFIIILLLGVISFLGTVLFVEETLPQQKRKLFNFSIILRDYIRLAKSFKFMCYVLIVNFPFTAIMVYIANLSIILINHFGLDLKTFSYYQATTMGTFIIFSLISIKLIGRKGLDYTKNLGAIVSLIGTIGLFCISQIDEKEVNIICLSMAFVAAGGAMMAGTFGMKALSIFPEMNGTAMAMMTAVRQLLASGLVVLSEILFDGSIVPIAMIIFIYAAIASFCYALMCLTASFQPKKVSL